jgi:hypothetical protein
MRRDRHAQLQRKRFRAQVSGPCAHGTDVPVSPRGNGLEAMAMSEAEDRYLAEIRDDCAMLLGRGIELVGLEREDGPQVRLVARYRLGDTVWASAAAGETVVAAHADLRARLLLDRVRIGFTALTRP